MNRYREQIHECMDELVAFRRLHGLGDFGETRLDFFDSVPLSLS